MILPFSTQLNGKPTYFIDKIWSGLIDKKLSTIDICRFFELEREKLTPKEFAIVPHYKPKLHTIREDQKERWKAGNKIDFFINCRQKDMFRFAPVLPVVSVQKIDVIYSIGSCVRVLIDQSDIYAGQTDGQGIKKHYKKAMLELAQNDGFDTIEDFFAYFNEDFEGKIIHWTDLRY